MKEDRVAPCRLQRALLTAAQAYDSCVQDAEGHDGVLAFFRRSAQQDVD